MDSHLSSDTPNTKSFKLDSINTYSSTEWLANRQKNYRQVFTEIELSYVYVEVKLINKWVDEQAWKANIILRCIRLGAGSDHNQEICKLEHDLLVKPDEQKIDIREGWGAANVNTFWKKGKYRWEIFLNDERIGFKDFSVVDLDMNKGGWKKYFSIKSLKLYEGPNENQMTGNRTYYGTFDVAKTRFIWAEFSLENKHSEEWEGEFMFNFYNSKNQLKGQTKELYALQKHPHTNVITSGWGSNVANSWFPDFYKLEIVFMDQVIATIEFQCGNKFDKKMVKDSGLSPPRKENKWIPLQNTSNKVFFSLKFKKKLLQFPLEKRVPLLFFHFLAAYFLLVVGAAIYRGMVEMFYWKDLVSWSDEFFIIASMYSIFLYIFASWYIDNDFYTNRLTTNQIRWITSIGAILSFLITITTLLNILFDFIGEPFPTGLSDSQEMYILIVGLIVVSAFVGQFAMPPLEKKIYEVLRYCIIVAVPAFISWYWQSFFFWFVGVVMCFGFLSAYKAYFIFSINNRDDVGTNKLLSLFAKEFTQQSYALFSKLGLFIIAIWIVSILLAIFVWELNWWQVILASVFSAIIIIVFYQAIFDSSIKPRFLLSVKEQFLIVLPNDHPDYSHAISRLKTEPINPPNNGQAIRSLFATFINELPQSKYRLNPQETFSQQRESSLKSTPQPIQIKKIEEKVKEERKTISQQMIGEEVTPNTELEITPPKEKVKLSRKKRKKLKQQEPIVELENNLGNLHNKKIDLKELIKLVYQHEIHQISSVLRLGLSALIACDKIVVTYLWEEIVAETELKPIILEVQGPSQIKTSLLQGQLSLLKDQIQQLKKDEVLVVPHLDLLAGGSKIYPNDAAREFTELVYRFPNHAILAFVDISLEIPDVLASRFSIRKTIEGIPKEVYHPQSKEKLPIGRILVTEGEVSYFDTFDPEGLYKNVSGMNPVQIRHAISYAIQQQLSEKSEKRITMENLYQALRSFKRSSSSSKFEIPDVAFSDIGGYRDVIADIEQMVDLMRGVNEIPNPKMRKELIPRGLIFYGPPGTGKTLFAKAIANKLNANVMVVSGPETIDKYVGESERKIREIFAEARRHAPSVLVFDEFDSIATKRTSDSSGSSRVGNSMVAQILTEMDGFRPETMILVIGTTNRIDIIDDAMLRPSRFHPIAIELPDTEARREIACIHANKFELSLPDEYIDVIAQSTRGFNGDEIRLIFREAYLKRYCQSPAIELSAREMGKIVGHIRFRKERQSATPRTLIFDSRRRLSDISEDSMISLS